MIQQCVHVCIYVCVYVCACVCRDFEVAAGPGGGEGVQDKTVAGEDQKGLG